jgi:hypothetical protein
MKFLYSLQSVQQGAVRRIEGKEIGYDKDSDCGTGVWGGFYVGVCGMGLLLEV